MITSFVLLDWHLALRTLVSSDVYGPSFVDLIQCLFARLTFVPGNLAAETYISFATLALNLLLSFFRALNHCLTSRIWTEPLIV